MTRSQPPVPSGTQNRGNCSFAEVLGTTDREASGKKETKDSPPGPPPGEGVVRSPSPEEQTSPSLGRPSQGRSAPTLAAWFGGAWTGGAAALRPAPRRAGWRLLRLMRGSGGGGRGPPLGDE